MTYIVSGGALNSTHSLTSLCSGHYRFLCHIYVALCYMCRPTASADEYKSISVYIAHYRTVPLMRSVFMSDIKTKRKTNQHLICFESKCPHVLFTIFGNFTNSRPVQKLRKFRRLSWLPPDEENSVWNLVSVLSATMMPLLESSWSQTHVFFQSQILTISAMTPSFCCFLDNQRYRSKCLQNKSHNFARNLPAT